MIHSFISGSTDGLIDRLTDGLTDSFAPSSHCRREIERGRERRRRTTSSSFVTDTATVTSKSPSCIPIDSGRLTELVLLVLFQQRERLLEISPKS
jgi:hypothetical protein